MPEVLALMSDSRVCLVKSPTYRYGMGSRTDCNKRYIRQNGSLMTSGRHLAHVLSINRSHRSRSCIAVSGPILVGELQQRCLLRIWDMGSRGRSRNSLTRME